MSYRLKYKQTKIIKKIEDTTANKPKPKPTKSLGKSFSFGPTIVKG
jgi:hypothetical protein